jgi:hypothetical protein
MVVSVMTIIVDTVVRTIIEQETQNFFGNEKFAVLLLLYQHEINLGAYNDKSIEVVDNLNFPYFGFTSIKPIKFIGFSSSFIILCKSFYNMLF